MSEESESEQGGDDDGDGVDDGGDDDGDDDDGGDDEDNQPPLNSRLLSLSYTHSWGKTQNGRPSISCSEFPPCRSLITIVTRHSLCPSSNLCSQRLNKV